MTYNGQIYALPETLEAITFFYNKKLITADKLPKTTTELKQMMTSYNKANPGQYFAVWDPNNAYCNAPWFYGAGAQYVDDQGNAHLDTPEALAAAQFIRSLQGLMPKDIDANVADALFNDGKAAIELTGPWRIADLKKPAWTSAWPRYPLVDFGKGGPARPFVGVKCLMLAHGSKNADVAVDIMKFYTSAEEEQTHGQGHRRSAGCHGCSRCPRKRPDRCSLQRPGCGRRAAAQHPVHGCPLGPGSQGLHCPLSGNRRPEDDHDRLAAGGNICPREDEVSLVSAIAGVRHAVCLTGTLLRIPRLANSDSTQEVALWHKAPRLPARPGPQ